MEDLEIKDIPNTFLPNCRSQMLSVRNILYFLKHGAVSFDRMPREVADRVQKALEMNKNPLITSRK